MASCGHLPSARAVPARDRDLLDADSHLTDPQLDILWAWFFRALEEKEDSQIMFVKLVNVVTLPTSTVHYLRIWT